MTGRAAASGVDDLAPLFDLLAETTTLTLATLDPDRTPRATPLYFALTADVDLVFLSDPKSPHAANLARNPQAAVAAYPEVADWREIRGVQMKGVVELLEGEPAAGALEAYGARHRFLAEVPAVWQAMRVYRFRPGWARCIDNRRGFGFRQEWDFG